jgi:hypothetical protein
MLPPTASMSKKRQRPRLSQLQQQNLAERLTTMKRGHRRRH